MVNWRYVSVASGVGIVLLVGVILYRRYKLGVSPGLLEAMAIPMLTASMMYGAERT
jgi:hypothetical protein